MPLSNVGVAFAGATADSEADAAVDEILDMAMEEGDEDMYGEEEIDFSAVTGPVVYTRSHIVGTPEGREFSATFTTPRFCSFFSIQASLWTKSFQWFVLW